MTAAKSTLSSQLMGGISSEIPFDLEPLAKALKAQFVLLGQRFGENLSFPYLWGEVPEDVMDFIKGEGVPISEHPLATMLLQSGSAYYRAGDESGAGKHFPFALAVESVTGVCGTVLGFIAAFRDPTLGAWSPAEREVLRSGSVTLRTTLEGALLAHYKTEQDKHTLALRRLEGLQALTAAVSKAALPEDVYEAALEQSVKILNMRAGGVTVLQPDGDLEIIANQGQPKAVIDAQRRVSLNANHPLAEVVRTGQPLYFHSGEERNARYPHLVPLFSPATRSSAFVPLRSGETTLGVLTLSFPEAHGFDFGEQKFIAAIADVCSQALERSRLLEKERQARGDLEVTTTQVRESEEHLKMGIEVANFVIADVDYQTGTIHLPSVAAKLYGLGDKDVVVPRARVHATFHPDDRTELEHRIAKALDPGGNGELTCEHRVVWPDGSVHWLNVRKQVFFDRSTPLARPTHAVLVAQDISERKRSEQALRDSEEKYRSLFETIDEGFCIIEVIFDEGGRPADYRFLETNQVFEAQTGLKKAKGKTALELVPNLEKWWIETYGKVALTGQAVRFENHSAPMGRWFDVYASRLGDETSRRVALVFKDITQRKRFEEQTRLDKERFEIAEVAAQGFLYDYSPRTGVVRRSANFKNILGYEDSELSQTGTAWESLFHEADRAVVEAAVANNLSSQVDESALEYRVRHKDGHYVTVLDRAKILRNEAGDIERIVGMSLDISERKRAEEALRESERALREADKRKDEFLATLAHELRNPLAPIRMAVEIMKRSNDAATQQEAKNIIERQSEQLTRLVDDLLDVSRISRGTITLQHERVELSEVVTIALESSHLLMEDKDHDLIVSLPVAPIFLHGDKTRLCQIVLNLLTNAAKYTNPHGKITLSAKQEGGEVVISVQDTGIGIPREMLERVFEMFTRVERKESYQQQGLGIGLSLVKQLVELHGGRVEVFSAGEGQGSTFTVHLPADTGQPEPKLGPENKEHERVSRRVLLVDDYEANLKTLARMLKLIGHEVVTAEHGARALEVLSTFKPEVILLDLNMPGLSGYEVAARIKSNPAYRGVKLVALTGYGQEEDLRRTKEAGFDEHLVKPVDMTRLEHVIGS